jgi:hypothetical protein
LPRPAAGVTSIRIVVRIGDAKPIKKPIVNRIAIRCQNFYINRYATLPSNMPTHDDLNSSRRPNLSPIRAQTIFPIPQDIKIDETKRADYSAVVCHSFSNTGIRKPTTIISPACEAHRKAQIMYSLVCPQPYPIRVSRS